MHLLDDYLVFGSMALANKGVLCRFIMQYVHIIIMCNFHLLQDKKKKNNATKSQLHLQPIDKKNRTLIIYSCLQYLLYPLSTYPRNTGCEGKTPWIGCHPHTYLHIQTIECPQCSWEEGGNQRTPRKPIQTSENVQNSAQTVTRARERIRDDGVES